MTDQSTAALLRSFVERYEQLDAQADEIAAVRRDLMAEVKGNGFDAAPFREIIRLRKMTPDDLAEREALLQMYREAVGV